MSSWLSNPFKPSSHDDPTPDDSPSMFSAAITAAANFLAPPPAPQSDESPPSKILVGIKNDLVEISKIFTTSFLRVKNDDNDEMEVGVNEEVIQFAKDISLRPHCWTQFPLQLQYDFNMSDVQREHAATVEYFVPSLEALRHKICSSLSEEQFWMIYFILLLPRLNENDYNLLSTPEIVEVREILLQKLQNKNNESLEISKDSETANATRGLEMSNTEQRLGEEDTDKSAKEAENEEDVSFSDLEYDSNDLFDRPPGFRQVEENNKIPSRAESSEWVRLNESSRTLGGTHKAGTSVSPEKNSEGEESSDWLRIDDVDLDSVAAA